MDFIFNRKDYYPSSRFLGNYSEEAFGVFSRYEIKVRFKNLNQWDIFTYDFLFDTGAYISLAPENIINRLNIQPEFETLVYGIVFREECRLDVKVARINLKIIDDNNRESRELNIWFAFHTLENGPFLIGMKNFISNIGISKEISDDKLILKIE